MSMVKNAAISLAALMACIGTAASADISTTLSRMPASGGGTTFSYNAMLTSYGVTAGDSFVIYDFGGLVGGSLFAPTDWTASVQATTSAPPIVFGTDSPTLNNLVFTYNGAGIRTAVGSSEGDISLGNFGAITTSSNTQLSDLSAYTTKNSAGVTYGTKAFNAAQILTPAAAVPEASTWAMLMIGFGGLGATMRRRNKAANGLPALA